MVINQSRLVNGWITRTANELDPTIRIWHKVFVHEKIPCDAETLDALYFRAFGLRQICLQNGKEPPVMNAELLTACWTGPNGLRAELERERIAKGRTLPQTAESVCPRCFGKNWENIHDNETGRVLGVKPNCDHRPLQPGEWLYEKMECEQEKENEI